MALHTLILGLGAVVAVAAAVRSTWSPCGLSMLSTITPFGERSRGHRYAVTASWFVAGSVLGGLTLGGLAAGLAAAVAATGVSADSAWLAGAVALAAGVTTAIDADVFGEVIPIWRRQVNDQWLARYRSWVYGVGFGWQIGVGVATYIMTAAVFLVVLLAAVSARPGGGGGPVRVVRPGARPGGAPHRQGRLSRPAAGAAPPLRSGRSGRPGRGDRRAGGGGRRGPGRPRRAGVQWPLAGRRGWWWRPVVSGRGRRRCTGAARAWAS